MYICKNCNRIFERKSNYVRHVEACSKQKEQEIYICYHCDKQYKTKWYYNKHIEKCNKKKEEKKIVNQTIINNDNRIYNQIDNSKQITNQNITNQNIIFNVQIAGSGEEKVEHITVEKVLEIMNKKFPNALAEFMRLIYFNKNVPENQRFCVLYPNEKYGALQYNNETDLIERILTDETINKHFENVVYVLSPIVDNIIEDKKLEDELTHQQKKNLNLFYHFFGLTEISKEKPDEYEHLKMMAYNNKTIPMEMWKEIGLKGVYQ